MAKNTISKRIQHMGAITCMKNDLWSIKALWIGNRLSTIERLSLNSFLCHGHRVELFAYEDIRNIPQGVVVRDGNEILGEDRIFVYDNKPSYAGFANWFRYLMLYREGGVWVDTDVVCLKPFDFDKDMFFGLEQSDQVNNAVVGAKPGNDLFRFLAAQVERPNDFLAYDTAREKRRKLVRRYLKGDKRGNVKWGETGPVGFTKALKHFGYFDQALPITAFYPVHFTCQTAIFDDTYPNVESYFPDSFAIHLWNEIMRRDKNFRKDGNFPQDSLVENLKRSYLD